MIVAYFTEADPKVVITRSGIIKLVELLLLIISMSTFFTGHVSRGTTGSSLYFVATMQVSAFLHTTFLLIAFVLGGMAIQRTLLDLMVGSFYVLMLLISSIVAFCISGDGAMVASGIFLLFCSIVFAGDCYVAIENLRSRPVVTVVGGPGAAVGVQPRPAQQLPTHNTQSQPYTAPPAYNTPPGLVGGGPYTIPVGGQGGQMVGQGGQMVGQGGQMVGQGGQMVGQGGHMVGQGGQMVGQGGHMVGKGGHMVGQGGQMVGQGGQMVGQGGQMVGQGGQMGGQGDPMGGKGAGMGGKGDVSNAYDNNDDIYTELVDGPTKVYYNEGGKENII